MPLKKQKASEVLGIKKKEQIFEGGAPEMKPL
jgi:hypothetical protein